MAFNKIIHRKRSVAFARKKNNLPGQPVYKVVLETDYKKLRSSAREYRGNYRIDMNGLFILQALNKIKEIELKRKAASGAKIRVAFVVDTLAKFTSANVYWEMAKDSAFEPFVALYSLRESNFRHDLMWEEYKAEYENLRKRGFAVYNGYDDNRNYIPLEYYRPDIVFITAFYLDATSCSLSGLYANVNFLVCQLNYGFNASNSYHYHYNNRQVNTAWKYFVETREDYNELIKFSYHYGLNAVYSGSPRLDNFDNPVNPDLLPKKIDFNKPTVIYAPHWTIKGSVNIHDISTFDLYYDFFLDMARDTPDINFIFKPHPSLASRLHNIGLMSFEEYDAYKRKWNALPNACVLIDDAYQDVFKQSSLLVTDSFSFIFEWLPTHKPCIYLVNTRKDKKDWLAGFSPQARKILRTYYLAHNKEEIALLFKKLLKNGDDGKKAQRDALASQIFENGGSASGRIVAYLKDTLGLEDK